MATVKNKQRTLYIFFGILLFLQGVLLISYIDTESTVPKLFDIFDERTKLLAMGGACILLGLLCFLVKKRGMLMISGLVFLTFSALHLIVVWNLVLNYSNTYSLSTRISIGVTAVYLLLFFIAMRGYVIAGKEVAPPAAERQTKAPVAEQAGEETAGRVTWDVSVTMKPMDS